MAGKKTKKNTGPQPKKNLCDMDVDEFMKTGLDSGSEYESETEEASSSEDKGIQKMQMKKSSVPKDSKHKQSLEKLKEQDPDFYDFLKNEDQELLNFNESDSDLSDDDSEDDGRHKLPEKLEVASDEEESGSSDDNAQDAELKKSKKSKQKARSVTMKMIQQWSTALQTQGSPTTIHHVVQAFKAAVHETGAQDNASSQYKVEGSTVFNGVVRLCLADLLPAMASILNVPETTRKDGKQILPATSKSWSRVRQDIKSYLTDLIQLMSQVAEPAVVNVILKHVHKLVTYYACFPKLTKAILKHLVKVWSSAEETSRVLAFLSINKLTRLLQNKLLRLCLKQMYVSYVKNCKFTSPSTLPLINFMQRSLVEIFTLDASVAYEFGFVYIRQLAIHLRNAITVKKKETSQSVYNWQYIHCLYLWARLLSTAHPNEELQPLIYPLTQTIIGTMKLIPTTKYYPLRFHCIKTLNMISQYTGTFVPVLPFLLEVFEQTDFNKKHATLSFKPLNFVCMLKLSKAQLQEKGFRDGLIDQLYELFMDHFHIHAHTIGFPELALPAVIQIKDFLKKCKVANYCKQIKQILEKVDETSRVITHRRKSSTLNLTDTKSVEAWEVRSKQEGTPLGKYYSTWRKMRDHELQYELAGKDRLTDDIPVIKRRRPEMIKATTEERKEFSALFDSGSEDSEDENTRFLPKSERPAKKQNSKLQEDNDLDYSDFDSDELEQLAMSADEDESADSNDGDDGNKSEQDSSMEGSDGNESEQDSSMEDVSDKEDIVEDFELSDSD